MSANKAVLWLENNPRVEIRPNPVIINPVRFRLRLGEGETGALAFVLGFGFDFDFVFLLAAAIFSFPAVLLEL